MRSWWPFLCYAVATYGLLVRVLLFIWAIIGLRRALCAISFDHQGCNALHRRLTGPVFPSAIRDRGTADSAAAEPKTTHLAGSSVVLLAEELTIDAALLTPFLQTNFGWQISKTLPVQIDHPSGNADALGEVSTVVPRPAGIVIGIPARRAPIKAIALFLQKVMAASGGAETLVLLFGARDGDTFASVNDEDFAHWRNFNAIHGLHLGLEKWRSS